MGLRAFTDAVRRPWPRPRKLPDALAVLLIAAVAAGGLMAEWWLGRRYVSIWRLTRGVGDTMFYSGDGRPWFPLDEARRDVALDQVSPFLVKGVIAVEDHRFYHHPGIDPVGLARASVRNLRSGGVVQGGSTLTQQLARTLFLSNERTWARKGKEAVLALMLEQVLTKDQILELYLNRIYLSGGVYGVEAMSKKLFVKRARDLTLPEAALVAGLIRAPSALSPWSNLDGALQRSRTVLERMREQGFISAEDERAAKAPHPHHVEPRAGRHPLRLRQGVPAPALPRPDGRRSPSGLAGAHDVPARGASSRGAGGGRRAEAARHPRPAGGARGDRPRDGRHARARRRA